MKAEDVVALVAAMLKASSGTLPQPGPRAAMAGAAALLESLSGLLERIDPGHAREILDHLARNPPPKYDKAVVLELALKLHEERVRAAAEKAAAKAKLSKPAEPTEPEPK